MLIKDIGFLFAILKMCDDIELYKLKFGSGLLSERIGLNACLLNISQIGEYAKKLSDEFQKNHHCVEWTKIKAMRNLIVHDYFGVDQDIVETIVYVSIPALIDLLTDIVNKLTNNLEIDPQMIEEFGKDLVVIKLQIPKSS